MAIGGRVREGDNYSGYFCFGFDAVASLSHWWYGALHHWFDEVQYAYIWVGGISSFAWWDEENVPSLGMHVCTIEQPPSQYDPGCGAF